MPAQVIRFPFAPVGDIISYRDRQLQSGINMYLQLLQ